MKKAQTQQIFTYLLALIVVGSVVIIGYRTITGLTETSCQVAQTDFGPNLESIFDRNTAFGSREEANIGLPCDYDKICLGEDPSTTSDTSIQAALENSEQNIFLLRGDTIEHNLEYGYLAADHEVVCLNTSGGSVGFTVRGVGQGTIEVQR